MALFASAADSVTTPIKTCSSSEEGHVIGSAHGANSENRAMNRQSPGPHMINFTTDEDNSFSLPLPPSVCSHSSPIPAVATPPPPVTAEDSEQARLRELEESERLAWQLMQEESTNAYEMQLEFMRNNPSLFSNEEVEALNMILQQDHIESQVHSDMCHHCVTPPQDIS